MSNVRLIDIQIGRDEIAKINRRLGEMQGKSPSILKKEINKAAEQMKKSLSREAKKKYVNTDVGMFRDAMDVKKATVGKLTATIEAKGRPRSLIKFQTAGGTDGESVSAKVFRNSKLEELTNTKAQPNIKSFIAKMSNKKKDSGESVENEHEHEGVFQRVEKGKVPARSKLGRRYIRELKGPSIPHMLGLRKFPEGVKEDTMTRLHRNIENDVAKMLGG